MKKIPDNFLENVKLETDKMCTFRYSNWMIKCMLFYDTEMIVFITVIWHGLLTLICAVYGRNADLVLPLHKCICVLISIRFCD